MAARLSRLEELRRIPSGTALDAKIPRNETIGSDPVGSTPEEVVEAFLEGAALESQTIAPKRIVEFFRGVGAILRECLEGTANVMRVQENFLAQFGVGRPGIRTAANNPLLFSVGYREIASNLLLREGDGFVRGPEAAKEAMETIKDQIVAQYAAMRAAAAKRSEAVDPESAEREVEVFDEAYGHAYKEQMLILQSARARLK